MATTSLSRATGARITALRLLAPDASATVVRTFAYDEAGRLTEDADSTGIPYRFTYDPASRITSWTDRNDSTYAYEYDRLGRCVATRGTDGFLSSCLAYDDSNRTTTFTDSLGHRRTYAHDAAYRLIAETDPLGHTTTQEWDAAGRHVTASTDALGQTIRYTYDEAGNLTDLVLPDGTVARASSTTRPASRSR